VIIVQPHMFEGEGGRVSRSPTRSRTREMIEAPPSVSQKPLATLSSLNWIIVYARLATSWSRGCRCIASTAIITLTREPEMNERSPFSETRVRWSCRSTTTAAVVADLMTCSTAAPTFGTSRVCLVPGSLGFGAGAGVADALGTADPSGVPGMISSSFADGRALRVEHPDNPRTRNKIPQIVLFMPG
jgi:hypothetical protein